MWSQSFLAPGSTEPRAGVPCSTTRIRSRSRRRSSGLSAGPVFGADVSKGYQCTLTRENAIPGRLRATRVCWNDGLVISRVDHQDRHLGAGRLDGSPAGRRRDRDAGYEGPGRDGVPRLRAAQSAKLIRNVK